MNKPIASVLLTLALTQVATAATLEASRPQGIAPSGVRDANDPTHLVGDTATMEERVRRVELDACAPGTSAPYTFSVRARFGADGDGAWHPASWYGPEDLSSCSMSIQVPFEGDWEFRVDLVEGGSPAQAATRMQVRDLWMTSIGDSYSSGEGAPDTEVPDTTRRTFEDLVCHRSSFGWPYQVVEAVTHELGEGTQLLFSYLPCSGAALDDGIISSTSFEGPERLGVVLPSQVDQLLDLKAASRPASPYHRHVLDPLTPDLVLVSGGGNDAGFGRIVQSCLFDAEYVDNPVVREVLASLGEELPPTCDDVLAEYADHENNPALDRVSDGYADLAWALERSDLVPDRVDEEKAAELDMASRSGVLAIEYPDVTRDEAGDIEAWCALGMRDHQMEAAYRDVLLPLNERVRVGTKDNEWAYMAGTMNAFRESGMCSDTPYINTLDESVLGQQGVGLRGRVTGTMHPNVEGFTAMANVALPYVRTYLDVIDLDARLPDIDAGLRTLNGPLPGVLTGNAVLVLDGAAGVEALEVRVDGTPVQPDANGHYLLPEPPLGAPIDREVVVERTWNPQGAAQGVPLPPQAYRFTHANRQDGIVELEVTAITASGDQATLELGAAERQDGGVWLEDVRFEIGHPDPNATVSVTMGRPGFGPQAYQQGWITAGSQTQYRTLYVTLDRDGQVSTTRLVFAVVDGEEALFENHLDRVDLYDHHPFLLEGQEAPLGATRRFADAAWSTTSGDLDESWSGLRYDPRWSMAPAFQTWEPCATGWCKQWYPYEAPSVDWAIAVDGRFEQSGLGPDLSVGEHEVSLVVCLNALADCSTGAIDDPKGAVRVDPIDLIMDDPMGDWNDPVTPVVIGFP